MSILSMFLLLMFAHLVADYPLQGDFLANTKGKNMISLVSHAGIWTGCICIMSWAIGLPITPLDVLWLFATHAIADYMKAKPVGFYKKLNPLGKGLLIDQLFHVLQIVVLMALKVM
ncbi:MAG: DUF3307 domain-containing protein [Psychrobacillus sp.]